MSGANAWQPAPQLLDLSGQEVHVWRVGLRSDCAETQTLSATELTRAARFRSDADRERFIISHAALRRILARYLRANPRDIQFAEDSHGKPHLAGPHRRSGVAFNLSHAGDVALVAVARDRAVGVDVERVVPVPERVRIVEQLFSPAERSALARLPEADRLAGFFTCWTHKEACIKARGEGFLGATRDFTVTLIPGSSARLLEGDGLALEALDPGEGYVGAVAVVGDSLILRCYGE